MAPKVRKKKERPKTSPRSARPPGQGDMGTIRPVDLSLHGDGVSHWQDEPRPEDENKSREDIEQPAGRHGKRD